MSGETPSKSAVATPALPIAETRQLIFSRPTWLDAILYNDRASQGWLHRAVVHSASVRGGESVAVVITAERDGYRQLIEVELGPAQIAAAMIRYCRALRIPLPRSAQKSLEVQGDAICLKITVNLTTAPLHSRV